MKIQQFYLLLILAGIGTSCSENPEFLHKWDGVVHREPLRVDMKQLRRPLIEETFLAPPADLSIDTYPTGYHYDKLDLLLVVDNSGSMTPLQQNLAKNFKSLISQLDDVDWQIAIVTTTESDGLGTAVPNYPCPRNIVRKADLNRELKFQNAVNVGDDGDNIERGILMAVRGLRGQNCGPWVRPGSAVAVLIVSSEDNCEQAGTPQSACPGAAWESADYLVNALTAMGRILGRSARVYGILGVPLTDECATEVNGWPGTTYRQAVERTGGRWESICQVDYGETLARFSKDISQLLGHIDISHEPIWDTVKLSVNGTPWTGRVKYDQLRVSFEDPLPDDSLLTITYAPVNARSFTLTKEPFEGVLQLTKDGLSLAGPAFSFVPETRTFTVPGPIRGGEKIKATFIENIPLLTHFPIGAVPEKDLVRCWVNGRELAKAEYEILTDSGEVAFIKDPPPEEALIRCDI